MLNPDACRLAAQVKLRLRPGYDGSSQVLLLPPLAADAPLLQPLQLAHSPQQQQQQQRSPSAISMGLPLIRAYTPRSELPAPAVGAGPPADLGAELRAASAGGAGGGASHSMHVHHHQYQQANGHHAARQPLSHPASNGQPPSIAAAAWLVAPTPVPAPVAGAGLSLPGTQLAAAAGGGLQQVSRSSPTGLGLAGSAYGRPSGAYKRPAGRQPTRLPTCPLECLPACLPGRAQHVCCAPAFGEG